ncbi:MAG: hypothetical protein CMH56_01990 [Myxococcales bacterium]|nr:hypothetical protein [Myxococcales bacterium]
MGFTWSWATSGKGVYSRGHPYNLVLFLVSFFSRSTGEVCPHLAQHTPEGFLRSSTTKDVMGNSMRSYSR